MRRVAPMHGLSLVELLVAMTLGLLIVGGASVSFNAHKRSAQLGQALVDLQSRARFALDEISTGVRSAGFAGCASAVSTIPALPVRLAASATARATWQPVAGYVYSSGGWSPSNPDGYGSGGYRTPASGFAAPVEGTSALLVEGGVGPGGAVRANGASGSGIAVTGRPYGLARGTLAMIGDCSGSEVFHVAALDIDASGNSTLTPTVALLRDYDVNPDYPAGTRVLPYRRALYYVGQTGRSTQQGEPILALFEHLHPYPDNRPTELADGVEAMVVRFEQRSANGQSFETNAQSTDFDPALVVAVRVGLLLSQDAYRSPDSSPDAYVLAGQSIAAGTGASASGTLADARLRSTFERTTAVRARSQVTGL